MGMDRGIHILVGDKDYQNLQPLAVAKLFAKVVEQEKIDLVILGKQVWPSYLNDIDNRVKVFKVSGKRNSFPLLYPLVNSLSWLSFTGSFDRRKFYSIVFYLLLAALVSDIVFSLLLKECQDHSKKVNAIFLCSFESPRLCFLGSSRCTN